MNLTGWPAPVYDAGMVWVEKMRAAGIAAYNDPRGATPPCVLVAIRKKDDTDTDLTCGLTASWEFILLAPGVGNADAWLTLDRLDTAVRALLPGRASSESIAYVPSTDSPPLPAYRVEFDEEVTIP